MGGKYVRNYASQRGISREERQRIHPIWRGVGFAMIVLFPIIAYAGMVVLMDLNGKNNWMPVPVDLLMKRTDFLYQFIPDPMLYIKILIWFVLVMILFAVFTFLSFIISSTFGYTDRKDPYYVAPIKRQRRRRI